VPPRQPNCIGFVYSRLGIISEEKYVDPPRLKDFLKTFEEVHNIKQAKVLGVIFLASNGPIMAHVALLSDDKKSLFIENVRVEKCLVTKQTWV